MKKLGVAFVVLAVVLGYGSAVFASGHGKKRPVKNGILLVTFGTSVDKAAKVFEHIEEKAIAAFPDIPVRWAYTSVIIRKKLAKQGKIFDSPEVALAKMMDEGFTHVAVQSLHTIPGEEFHELLTNAQAFAGMVGGFETVTVGTPLLASQEDIDRTVAGMIAHIPKERKPEDAVVLMGHGSPHPSNTSYAALMYHFQRKDPNIFVGTVEGKPEIGEIRELLQEQKIKKAYLIPFMSVAGDHAMNDMVGDEADSWKNILAKAGIESVPVLRGTAEYDEIVGIWIDHLRQAVEQLR